jgi:hypothetical protein
MEQLSSVAALQTNYHLHYLGQPFVELQRRYANVIERLAHAQCRLRRSPGARVASAAGIGSSRASSATTSSPRPSAG